MHSQLTGDMICSQVTGLSPKEHARSKTMSEQTPSMGGLHQPPEKIKSLLSLVRENLQMDVAFVSQFAPGTSWSSARWRGMRDPSDGEKGKASHSMSPTASGCSTVASLTWSPMPGAKIRRRICG